MAVKAENNYPVHFVIYRKAGCLVLVRNTETQQYGGWLMDTEKAFALWGIERLESLPVIRKVVEVRYTN